MMVHYITEDLLCIVLSKLPVKSLLRFRCVSKLWLNIIDSSYFINLHSNQTAKTSTNNIIVPYKKVSDGIKPMYAFDFDNEDKSSDKARKIEPPVFYDTLHVLSCNGLIFLSMNSNKIVIWNPATHKHRVADTVKSRDDIWSCTYYSFGYDLKTDDYKVVMLESDTDFIVHIYSLKTGSWRKNIGTANREILKGTPYMSVYAGGSIHWMDDYVVRLEEPSETKNRIVSFDLTTEKWLPRTMPPEVSAIPSTYQTWSLSNHHGSLYASCSDDTEANNIAHTHIWVMKSCQGINNTTWTKLATIKGIHYGAKITPLWSLKKMSRHQLLLIDYNRHQLYDIEEETKEIKEEPCDVYNVHGVYEIFKSFICYETLVPV